MSRGWKIAIAVIAVLIVVCGLAMWGVWAVVVRGGMWDSTQASWAESEGDWDKAARHYERAVAAKPNAADLHRRYARALSKSGQGAEAMAQYEEAAQLDQKDVRALVSLARLQRDADEPEKAEKTLRSALERQADSALVATELGRLLAAQERWHEAAQLLAQARREGGNARRVAYDLGRSYEALDQRQEAITAYEWGADHCSQQCKRRMAELRGTTTGEGEQAEREEEDESYVRETEAAPDAAMGAFMAGFMAIYFGFILFMMAGTLLSWIVSALAIWDCAKREFDHGSTRGAWCLLIFLTRWIGALVYFVAVYRPAAAERAGQLPPTGSPHDTVQGR